MPGRAWSPADALVQVIELTSTDPRPEHWLSGFVLSVLRPLRAHCALIGDLGDDAHLDLAASYGLPSDESSLFSSVDLWKHTPYGLCVREGVSVMTHPASAGKSADLLTPTWRAVPVVIGVPALLRGVPVGSLLIGVGRLGRLGLDDSFWRALPGVLGLTLMAFRADQHRAMSDSTAEDADSSELTALHITMLRLMAEGRTQKQIAESLEISLPMVKWECRRMYQVLHVRGRADALRMARHLGHLP